jgi:hypothetical protein
VGMLIPKRRRNACDSRTRVRWYAVGGSPGLTCLETDRNATANFARIPDLSPMVPEENTLMKLSSIAAALLVCLVSTADVNAFWKRSCCAPEPSCCAPAAPTCAAPCAPACAPACAAPAPHCCPQPAPCCEPVSCCKPRFKMCWPKIRMPKFPRCCKPTCCHAAPTCCAPAPACCVEAPKCCAPAAPSCCAPAAPTCAAPTSCCH